MFSSSDRSELLLSLRFSYILVAAGGWFYPLPVIILEHAFPSTGFAVARLGCSLQGYEIWAGHDTFL